MDHLLLGEDDIIMPGKSYAITTKLKGPPAVTPWWSHNMRRGGSPCVIKRKLGYVLTHLKNLAGWEEKLHAVEALPPIDRHPQAVDNLRKRIKNASAWLDYSIETLRGTVRFARARIESDGDDFEEMRRLRAEAGDPIKHSKLGRTNKAWHDELLYYSNVLDQYLLAKTAASGTSRSDEAMREIWRVCGKAIANYKHKSGREIDDAEQQAALGILHAADKFDPTEGSFAKFATYAGYWIRRKMQTRKASDCKPGTTMVSGKTKFVGTLNVSDDDESRADQFHPEAENVDVSIQMDVRKALAQFAPEERDLIERRMMKNQTLHVIADELGVSLGTIRNRLKKLTERLQELLADHAPE